MNPEEYGALARVEERHWFYSGKRELVRRWLDRMGALTAGSLLVDVGAGTGLFAAEMQPRCRVVALDPDPEALRFIEAHANLPAVAASANALPLTTGSVAILTALDVIEHVDDDVGALREFARVVRPGGWIVLNVPALPALWSEWDEALHHRRRYTRASLVGAIRGLPVQIRHLSYTNTCALLPILAYRTARKFGIKFGAGRLEDRIPPAMLNNALRRLFVEPALWRFPMPVGVSLFCLLQRESAE